MCKYTVVVSHFAHGRVFGEVGRCMIVADDDSSVVAWANQFTRYGYSVLVDPIRVDDDGSFASYRSFDGEAFNRISFKRGGGWESRPVGL